MRKLGAFLVLVLLAFAVWIGARYIRHRGEVKVTIIFREAALAAGDPVVENNVVVGRVIREVVGVPSSAQLLGRPPADLEQQVAHRDDADRGGDDEHIRYLEKEATPVADGDIIYAKEDRLSRWLAKHGASVQPLIDKLKNATDEKLDSLTADNFDEKLAEWKAEVPQWKKEGSASVDRRVAELEARVGVMTRQLERANRAEEARRLKERFQAWLNDIRK